MNIVLTNCFTRFIYVIIGKKQRQVQEELSQVINVASKIATALEESESEDFNVNKTFVNYVYSRLLEMTPLESQKKRKVMLLALEDE